MKAKSFADCVLLLCLTFVANGVSASGFSFTNSVMSSGAHSVLQSASHAVSRYVSKADESPAVDLPKATGNFGGCRETFANGENPRVPSAMQSTHALCFTGFAVLYSGKTKTAVYSAEVLNRQRIERAQNESRTDQFFADARLPARERATLEDYRGSSFDRGHMAPAADMDSRQAMGQSFVLSNMVPQAPENNRKAWSSIEKATRAYVRRARGNVYVITGPAYVNASCPFVLAAQRALGKDGSVEPGQAQFVVALASRSGAFKAPHRYDASKCTIGDGVAVPSHLFKLVYDPSSGRAWAHWIENTDWARAGKPISYQELVARTGIEFLPGIHPKS